MDLIYADMVVAHLVMVAALQEVDAVLKTQLARGVTL